MRLPKTIWLCGAALACFGAATAVSGIAQRALLLAGGILVMLSAWNIIWWALRRQAARGILAETRRLTQADPDQVFLTDEAGEIIHENPAAMDRFGTRTGQAMSAVLGTFMASPEALHRRMLGQIRNGAAVKEDIVTRGGRFRLSVSQLAPAHLLWRLDDLGAAETQPGGSDQSGLPQIVAEPDGRIVHINAACRAFLGHSPASLSALFESSSVRSGQSCIVQAAAGPTRVILAEMPGQSRRREIYLVVLGDVDAPRTVGAGWDAIEDLPVPLMKIAPSGEVIASNREARQLLNIKNTDGKRIADMLDGLGRPINDWLREAAEGRGGHASQFLRGRGPNQDTFVQVTLNLSSDASEGHLIAVLNDVTELKTLEAQFVQSQKMQAIGQLAGGVAHDFNNLLTAISGHCDLLLLRHDEGDQNYGDLIQIHQNANRAASLVGQLLAFSRKQNLQPEIIDLRDTLSDLTHLLNRLVGEKVTLSLNHDPALMQIKADKRQLEQVLMNLVVNARDAMQRGGEIRIVTENMILKSQMVRDRATIPPGEYVVVKVIDEGHGITPDRLPKIFEPFYTTKRTGEGTGLGLSTAYGIVKQTGGYIFAESDVGKGTQFSLLFPSYDLPVAEPLEIQAAAPERASEKVDGVVLLVEDEAPVRAFASRALRLRGYTVLEADCAEAALDLLSDADLNVDIFVTDVIMPGMDGPTWVRVALEKRPDTKVVFVSGYAEDAFGDEKSRIPNSVFLPKPFSLSALTQTVQTQLEDHRQPVRATAS
ncbi:ATP-binding protein [Yoonia sp. SS1-5]|uniref:histidine kinase n=1 Tax=Yoonia rhodophyticola TaxID=3137370 RepID=A0AAN0NJT7_9RHOB